MSYTRPNLLACPNPACEEFKRRQGGTPGERFCGWCGTLRQPIEMCCVEETIHDEGFCMTCGAQKASVRFLTTEAA